MTNKFANKSFTPSANQSGNTGGGSNVDWKGLNEHVAGTVQEAFGCEEGTAAGAVGIISGIVGYGLHQDPVREEPMDEGDDKTKEWKQRQVDNGRATVADNGIFSYQAPARQEVGFFVDFYGATVDKGQFFGDSNPAPYRVLLGGYWDNVPAGATKVEGYPNDKNVWVFGDKSRATKLAKAAKLKELKDGFAQDRLLELIGTAMSFTVEVYVNDKGFLVEKVANPSPLMAGLPLPEINEDLLFYVDFNEDNTQEDLKILPKKVKEYIQAAQNYEGSKIQGQLALLEESSSQESSAPKETPVTSVPQDEPEEEPSLSTPEDNEPQMDFDESIPF